MDNAEAIRKREAARERKSQRRWIINRAHRRGGYWFSEAIPLDEHGTWNAYNNWYCRCDPCTEANRVKCAEDRAKRLEENSGQEEGQGPSASADE